MNSRLAFDFSQTMMLLGFLSRVQSKQQTPVGPAPIIKTVSSSVISDILVAQNPVARMSPTKSACSSLTESGLVQACCSIRNPHIFRLSAIDSASQSPSAMWRSTIVHVSMLAIEAFSTEGLYIHGYSVSRFHMGNPLPHFLYNAYHFVANSNPRYSARHRTMLDVKIAGTDTASVTLTMASCSSIIVGFTFSVKPNFPCWIYVNAFTLIYI